MTRDEVIRECIEYLRQRRGRNAIKCLEALLKQDEPKKVASNKDHPWRKL